MEISSADYFGKTGIIMLAIIGLLVTVVFYYTVITTSRGGNFGKVLTFGTVGIFTLIYKISNKQQKNLACHHCDATNTIDK